MKKYCVVYSYKMVSDAEVEAKSKEEASKKVQEIIGPVQIENAYEVHTNA
jgi:hypothetical protein